MPDVLINPFLARLLWVLLRVNSSLLEALLENRVLETEITCSVIVVEGVVSSEDIVVTPAKGPGVRSQHASIEAVVKGSLEHGDAELIVGTLVQLKESRSRAVCFADIFDTVASSGRQAVGQVELLGYLGHRKLSGRVVNAVDANWCKSNGGRHAVAKDFGCSVSLVGVNQHARDDAVPIESLSVGEMGPRKSSIARGVIPVDFNQSSFQCEIVTSSTYQPP